MNGFAGTFTSSGAPAYPETSIVTELVATTTPPKPHTARAIVLLVSALVSVLPEAFPFTVLFGRYILHASTLVPLQLRRDVAPDCTVFGFATKVSCGFTMRTEQREICDSTVPCMQLTPKFALLVADAGMGTLACPLGFPPVEKPVPLEAEVEQFQVILIVAEDARAIVLGSHLICGAFGCTGALAQAPAWQPY